MLIEFKDHRLPPGKLCFRLLRNVPNDLFESGEQKKVLPQLTGWELWAGRTDSETPAAATVVLERMLRGIGIPSGGSAGQVLVKKSDKDYDLQCRRNGRVPAFRIIPSIPGRRKSGSALHRYHSRQILPMGRNRTLLQMYRSRNRRRRRTHFGQQQITLSILSLWQQKL